MTAATLTVTLRDLLSGAADDELLTLGEWAKILPGRGRRARRGMSARVVLRHIIAGVRGHRLRSQRVGARHMVLGRNLREHLAAIAPGADRPAPRPSAMRLRARRAALARRAASEALR